MPFQTQALNDLAATIQGAATAAAQANALAANAQQQNAPLAIAGDAVEVNTDYTMDGTKAVVIADTATASADITITLPDAALNGGKMFWIKRTTGIHKLIVLPDGGQTIDGLSQAPGGGAPNVSMCLVAIGDNWNLLSQSVGTPTQFDAQVITADAVLDPSVPYWLLDASSNPVTLTLPAVATVEGQQFTFTCLNADHDATLAAATGEFLYLAGKPAATTLLGRQLGGMTLVLVARTVPSLPGLWVSQGIINPYSPTDVFVYDTTMTGQSIDLPDAVTSDGLLRAYKNAGTGGHSVTVNPAGTDTIDGAGTGVVVADGKSAAFVRQDGLATNWVLLSADAPAITQNFAYVPNTTVGDVVATLPDATGATGKTVTYKNQGGAGHSLTVNPAGTDTISGAGTGVVIADSFSVTFIRDTDSATNWITT